MTASAVIAAEISKRHDDNELALDESYRALVRRAVNGDMPKPGQAMDDAIALWQLKKVDQAQFDRDCQHLRERLAWSKQIDGLQAASERQAAIERERDALVAERNRLVAGFNAKLDALNSEHTQLSAKLATGEHAKDRLYNTFRNRTVLARERELSNQTVRLRDEINDAQQRLAESVAVPLAQARAQLRKENERVATSHEAGRDPRNATKVAQIVASIRLLEEREKTDRGAIASLVSQSDQLHAELSELARKHYEP